MSDTPPNPDDPYGSHSGPTGSDHGPAPSPAPKSESLWVRVLYMVLFAVIANFLLGIFLAASLLQIIVIAVSEKENTELREFLRAVLAYIGVTLAYIAFLDNQKPFPFSPFPHPVNRSG